MNKYNLQDLVHNLDTYSRRYEIRTKEDVEIDTDDESVIKNLAALQAKYGFTVGSRSACVFILTTKVILKHNPTLLLPTPESLFQVAKAVGAAFWALRHGQLDRIDDSIYARVSKGVAAAGIDGDLQRALATLGLKVINSCLPYGRD